ncbi:MAG: hypothetical protein H6Q30_785 [Bacteroidetes bacterium]|jgi:hypothetical protein|nr:hypothetical protein [Bacteroidota bacterium]
MKLFRRHYTPEEVGSMIYETLRAGMASSGDLSVKTLIDNLDRTEAELHDQYVGEIMIGAMFGALLAIDRSTLPTTRDLICRGMHREFYAHLGEQGASEDQVLEWQVVVQERFREYRRCMEQYEGYEPPWKMGRQLFWNITGAEEYLAMSIKIATLYVLAARDTVQAVLNQYGPSIQVLPDTHTVTGQQSR